MRGARLGGGLGGPPGVGLGGLDGDGGSGGALLEIADALVETSCLLAREVELSGVATGTAHGLTMLLGSRAGRAAS